VIRINLLPHRQERRRERQRQMVTLLAMIGGLGLLTVVLGHTVLAARLENQQSRNAFLRGQIKELDLQLEEIKRVKEETAALLSRKQVVESLQSNRSEAVHVLDQLLRVMPEGSYLKGVRQVGASINLTGYAQSNARVSTLLHNLNESPWLEGGELVEIHSAMVNDVRVAEFIVNVKIRRVQTAAAAAKAGAGGKAGAGMKTVSGGAAK
jgi:type IV pilus assembly protein PilN